MEPSKVDSLTTWPVPHIFKELQVFLGFANFYQRFINSFSCIVSGLSDMLKDKVKSKFNNKNFAMIVKAFEAFNKLKKRFTMVLMLVHYKPKKQIILKTNASVFAISGIIFHLIQTSSQWHLIAFWS